MIPTGRAWLPMLALTMTALAGCVTPPEDTQAASVELDGVLGMLPIQVDNVMSFAQSIVSPAVGTATDLYEPTMEVSDTGTIYVAGHTIAAATTGTPAYFSTDDGKTWAPLPFLASLQAPSPLQGSQPPPGDEGFLVAGENGQAWMGDIYLAGFSITGWCDNGATQCYDNRQAYDRVETLAASCGAQQSLNDRPWAAYGNGKLLLVNNPGGGPMQLGVMDVPPATPVGIGGGVASLSGPTWNLCASEGGWIPGVPAMRPDGFFAVPQIMGEDEEAYLGIVTGNADDIFDVKTTNAFPVTDASVGDSNGGRTAFDATGTLFVGAKNNTRVNFTTESDPLMGDSTSYEIGEGRFVLAVSTDDGATFKNATFASVSGKAINSLYLDGSPLLAGALVVWSELAETPGRANWYVGHVVVGADGAPELRDVTLALEEGSSSAAHIIGAGVGPDGRAYFLQFEDGESPMEYAGSTPISVWIQQEGPTLPLALASVASE